jgi:hypothetical protein
MMNVPEHAPPPKGFLRRRWISLLALFFTIPLTFLYIRFDRLWAGAIWFLQVNQGDVRFSLTASDVNPDSREFRAKVRNIRLGSYPDFTNWGGGFGISIPAWLPLGITMAWIAFAEWIHRRRTIASVKAPSAHPKQ